MSNPQPIWKKLRSRQNLPAVALLVGTIGTIIVWATGYRLGGSSDLTFFVGRFHPSLVHFPIGLLVFAIILDGWSRFRPTDWIHQATRSALYVGSWTAILAVVVGLHMEAAGGYDASTLRWHKLIGIALVVFGATTYVLRSEIQGTGQSPRIRKVLGNALLTGMLLSIIIGGHFGGDLTHHEGYLTRYAPDGIRTLIGLPVKADIGKLSVSEPSEARVFTSLVEPILQNRCAGCHNAQQNDGDLVLDSPEGIMAGGDDGDALIPGRSARSNIIDRISLPLHHDDHMPPPHRPQVTVAEATLLRWWIDEGASFEQTLGEATITPEIATLLDAYEINEIRSGIFAEDVPEPDSSILVDLETSGIDVSRLAETENFLEIRCARDANCTTPDIVRLIEAVSTNIAWLDLGESTVTDSSFSFVAGLLHLTRLHLDQTAITDDALSYLSDLQFLEYLNLYGTSITDTGLAHLQRLPALRSLYLWQTRTTPDGIDRLSAALPDLVIETGETGQ